MVIWAHFSIRRGSAFCVLPCLKGLSALFQNTAMCAQHGVKIQTQDALQSLNLVVSILQFVMYTWLNDTILLPA